MLSTTDENGPVHRKIIVKFRMLWKHNSTSSREKEKKVRYKSIRIRMVLAL